MIKRDDGYALSYVMVILLVLGLIMAAVTTISLHNLKRQQASIDRMQDKYVAQGLMEKAVAQLENATSINEAIDIINASGNASEKTTCLSSNDKLTLTCMYGSAEIVATIEVAANTAETGPNFIVKYTSYSTKIVEVAE